MSLALLGAAPDLVGWGEIVDNPRVMQGGTLTALPPPPAGQVYVRCEAGEGIREGYLLVPRDIADSTLMTAAVNPATKEKVWQLIPKEMGMARGRYLGQPYYPITEKAPPRKLDVAALKAATELPPTQLPAAAPAPPPVYAPQSPAAPQSTATATAARTAAAAGVAVKSCGASGDTWAWICFLLCLAALLIALWVAPPLWKSVRSDNEESAS